MPASSGPILLIVDDTPASLDFFRMRFEREGYIVRTAPDGKTAIEMVRAAPPDGVLLDVLMPELDGFAVLARLKADPATSQVPVLLLSVQGGREAVLKAVRAGAKDYILKTESFDNILARIVRVLGRPSTPETEPVAEDPRAAALASEIRDLASDILDDEGPTGAPVRRFEFKMEVRQGIVHVEIHGTLHREDVDGFLGAVLHTARGQAKRKVLIDFTRLVNSGPLAADSLRKLLDALRASGCRVRLVSYADEQREWARMERVDGMSTIYDSYAQAIRHMGG